MRTTFRLTAAMLTLAATALVLGVDPSAAQNMQWQRFNLPASGVTLRVPLAVFQAPPPDDQAQGRLFVSHDGKAQLLVGAFENDDGRSIAQHRKFVRSTQYAGANIDYAPIRRRWFVLSGTKDTRTFYQRVTFTCGGRIISSWAMLYPTSEKRFYDRLVEGMHRSFRAGRGPGGSCRFAPATN